MRLARITFPIQSEEEFLSLTAGQPVLLSGTIYTARDQAHSLIQKILVENSPLPAGLNLKGALIYYCGPTPPKPGRVVGAIGPTTSRRLDSFVPAFLTAGVKAFLGKGRRDPSLNQLFGQYQAIYLATYGGAGAYLSQFVLRQHLLAFPELGPEAVFALEVADFPARVDINAHGEEFLDEK